jgi:hypothetical protein
MPTANRRGFDGQPSGAPSRRAGTGDSLGKMRVKAAMNAVMIFVFIPVLATASVEAPFRACPELAVGAAGLSPMLPWLLRKAARLEAASTFELRTACCYNGSSTPIRFSRAFWKTRIAVAISSNARPRLMAMFLSLSDSRPGFLPATISPRSA